MNDDSLPNNFGRRVGDLRDLPEELREQLQVGKTDELEEKIVNSLGFLNGIANLDEVLVALFRMTGEVYKRTYISNKMYRMAQAGTIESVPKKKGVYRLPDRQANRGHHM
ncbi:hypothetical protein [Qipengyuania sp.]|uniref:hypothetical protein n=1 Tax=Qipengyuania sp. TaxID=2004515 RepID=UPI003BA96FFF